MHLVSEWFVYLMTDEYVLTKTRNFQEILEYEKATEYKPILSQQSFIVIDTNDLKVICTQPGLSRPLKEVCLYMYVLGQVHFLC